jgi:hypothetical protein
MKAGKKPATAQKPGARSKNKAIGGETGGNPQEVNSSIILENP